LADQQQVILKSVLEEPIDSDNNDNEATIKAKTFYKSCMDIRKLSGAGCGETFSYHAQSEPNGIYFPHATATTPNDSSVMYAAQIRKIGDQPLRDILKTLGGWPVIEPNWKPPNRSLENLMGTLRGDSEPVLIELYVGADDKNSSINILQVSREREKMKEAFRIFPFSSWISWCWRCLREITI
jgi:neprilysin